MADWKRTERRAAAAHVGICEDTLATWARRYPAFLADIQKAEAEAEVQAVAVIRQAANDGTWQAAAWWLERRRHEDYRRRDETEVIGSVDRPVRVRLVLGERDKAPVEADAQNCVQRPYDAPGPR